MKFSTQEEYGLRCLLQIARLGPEGSLSISEIAKVEGLTSPHVAKLMSMLRKGGFVVSARGHVGGYSLAEPKLDILVKDVLECLGGRLYDAEFCDRHSGALEICTHAVDCSVRSLWQVLQSSIDRALDGMRLSDMLDQGKSNVTFFGETLPRATIGTADRT